MGAQRSLGPGLKVSREQRLLGTSTNRLVQMQRQNRNVPSLHACRFVFELADASRLMPLTFKGALRFLRCIWPREPSFFAHAVTACDFETVCFAAGPVSSAAPHPGLAWPQSSGCRPNCACGTSRCRPTAAPSWLWLCSVIKAMNALHPAALHVGWQWTHAPALVLRRACAQ